jgi:hypothetical protein
VSFRRCIRCLLVAKPDLSLYSLKCHCILFLLVRCLTMIDGQFITDGYFFSFLSPNIKVHVDPLYFCNPYYFDFFSWLFYKSFVFFLNFIL